MIVLNLLVLYYSGAVGVGFYGNEDVHKGVGQFATAGEDADETIHTMQAQVKIILALTCLLLFTSKCPLGRMQHIELTLTTHIGHENQLSWTTLYFLKPLISCLHLLL